MRALIVSLNSRVKAMAPKPPVVCAACSPASDFVRFRCPAAGVSAQQDGQFLAFPAEVDTVFEHADRRGLSGAQSGCDRRRRAGRVLLCQPVHRAEKFGCLVPGEGNVKSSGIESLVGMSQVDKSLEVPADRFR